MTVGNLVVKLQSRVERRGVRLLTRFRAEALQASIGEYIRFAATRSQAVNEMDLQSFGQSNFGGLVLGDARRTKRLVASADIMSRHPGGTLPDKFSNPADLRAFYSLMDCDLVTHANVMRGHTAVTSSEDGGGRKAMGNTLLILHDATEILGLATSLKLLTEDSGPNWSVEPMLLAFDHNSLVVQAEPQLVLGLASQILHHRADVPKKETDAQRRNRASRESRLWVQGASQGARMLC